MENSPYNLSHRGTRYCKGAVATTTAPAHRDDAPAATTRSPKPCPNLRCPQLEDGTYRYTGGDYYNEGIPADSHYADFMYKLAEKLKAAVSIKYLCPGEEMDPASLITVADEDDFKVRPFVRRQSAAVMDQQECG